MADYGIDMHYRGWEIVQSSSFNFYNSYLIHQEMGRILGWNGVGQCAGRKRK